MNNNDQFNNQTNNNFNPNYNNFNEQNNMNYQQFPNNNFNNQNNMINQQIPNNNYNEQNNVNNEPVKKKKKSSNRNWKKIILYIFFSAIIIVSGIIFYLESQKEPDEPEIYDQLPSQIVVDEKEKQEVVVEEATIKLAPDVDLNHERQYYNNNDIVGRLEIPDLFNVLVTKTTNNEYYLSHSVYKEYDIRGTEFLDYRVSPTSKQVNVYGHNTRDINIKVAFLKLEKFLDKSFFDNNQYIALQYDGGKSLYKILAIKEVRRENREHMIVDKTGADFVAHVNNMTTGDGVINSRSVPYDEYSDIIVLQTCSHHWDNAYYTIIAVKVMNM